MPIDWKTHPREIISNRGRWEFDPANRVLYCGLNEGFFANCSVTLSGLLYLFHRYRILPERIDFSRGFLLYRDAVRRDKKTDLYPEYFCLHPDARIGNQIPPQAVRHHDSYRYQPIRAVVPFIDRYFSLADPIQSIEKSLREKYRIDTARTLAVCYRGTDKKAEVALADPQRVLRLTERLLESNPGLRVWIQTEVRQVADLFQERLGDRCFAVQELPMVDADQSTRALLSESEVISRRFVFGQNLLAITHLLSQCGWLINHTGSMACWIWLFRGNADRMWQFDRRGMLVSWRTPIREFWDRTRDFLYYRISKKILPTRDGEPQ
jgi:hypothetical protein